MAGDPATGRPPFRRVDCEEIVASEMDDAGRWCDGHLVIEMVDGVKRRRCVSRAALDRRDAAIDASPLAKKKTSSAPIVIGVVAAAVVAWLVLR